MVPMFKGRNEKIVMRSHILGKSTSNVFSMRDSLFRFLTLCNGANLAFSFNINGMGKECL